MKNCKKMVELLQRKIRLLENFIFEVNDINERHGYGVDPAEMIELERLSKELDTVQKQLDELIINNLVKLH